MRIEKQEMAVEELIKQAVAQAEVEAAKTEMFMTNEEGRRHSISTKHNGVQLEGKRQIYYTKEL